MSSDAIAVLVGVPLGRWGVALDDEGGHAVAVQFFAGAHDDDGHMARHALSVWRQSDGAKKVEEKSS